MEEEFNNYLEHNYVAFSIDIKQKQNKEGVFKKSIIFPKGWNNFTIDNTRYNETYNALALMTG